MLKPGPGISALGEHNDSKLNRCLDVHTQQVKALPMVDYAGSKRSTILLPINCSSCVVILLIVRYFITIVLTNCTAPYQHEVF